MEETADICCRERKCVSSSCGGLTVTFSLSPPSSPAPNDTARTSPSVTALPGSTCWVAVHCSAGGVCGRCTGPASSLPSTSSSCNPVSTPGMPSLAYTNCSSLSLCVENMAIRTRRGDTSRSQWGNWTTTSCTSVSPRSISLPHTGLVIQPSLSLSLEHPSLCSLPRTYTGEPTGSSHSH